MSGKNIWNFFKTPIADHLKNLWNNLHDFFTSPSRARWYAIIGIIIVVVALPVTVTVLQQQTVVKQQAALICGDNSNYEYNGCGQQGGCSNSYPAKNWVSYDYNPYKGCAVINCQNHGTVAGHCGYTPPRCDQVGGICTKSNCVNGTANGTCPAGDWTCCKACNPGNDGAPYCCSNFGAYHLCQDYHASDCYKQTRDLGVSNSCKPPAPDQAACTAYVDSHPYDFTKGSGECLSAKNCQLNGPDNATEASSTACNTKSGTICCAQISHPTNCATGTFAPPDTGTCIDLNTQTCNETGTARTTTDCGGSGNPGLKYCCKTSKVAGRTITCDHVNAVYPYNTYKDSVSGSRQCASNEICTTTITNGSPCAKTTSPASNARVCGDGSQFGYCLYGSRDFPNYTFNPDKSCGIGFGFCTANLPNCNTVLPGSHGINDSSVHCNAQTGAPIKCCAFTGPPPTPTPNVYQDVLPGARICRNGTEQMGVCFYQRTPGQPDGFVYSPPFASSDIANSCNTFSCIGVPSFKCSDLNTKTNVRYPNGAWYDLGGADCNDPKAIGSQPRCCAFDPNGNNGMKTCSDIIPGGKCPIALTGKICPDGYHDSGADHPNSFCKIGGHACCIPDSSCGGEGQKCCTTGNKCATSSLTCNSSGICEKTSGGPGGGCTKGKTTGFSLSIKLDGIGTGKFENNDPKHPNRTGHVRVFNTANPSKNIHGSSQALNHGKDSGKFDSAKIDLKTSLTCGATYKVEVKLPGYLPASAEVKYGDTNQTISLEPLGGDINKVDLTTKEIVGDGKIGVEDYSIYKTCLNQDPTTPIPFKSDTQTVNLTCGDLINFFDFQDGGTMENVPTASGVGEWDANYNLWLRSYVKANGF